MSIQVCSEICTGCGRCVAACPGSLFKLERGKAVMCYPEQCWGCTACLKECAYGAIGMFLGADVGGRGTQLSVRRDGTQLCWDFTAPTGEKRTVTVNAKDANRY